VCVCVCVCVCVYIYIHIYICQLKAFWKLSLGRRSDEFFPEILLYFPMIIRISLFDAVDYFKHLIAGSKDKLSPVMKYS